MKKKHITVTTAAALASFLMLSGCVAAPQKNSKGEFPVCHTAAVDWPTNLTLEQLKDEPLKQLDGEIGMVKDGVSNVVTVATWREFDSLSSEGYEPADGMSLGMAGWFVSERGIIPFWEHAIPAKQSFVRPLPMNRRLLQWLPLDLGPQISNEEIEAVAQATKAGKSWLEFHPDTKIIKQTSDSIQLSVDGFIITLTVMAYGDFGHDGYDDALVCVSHSAIGGTLNYSFNAMLTRTNASDRLRLLIDSHKK
jgi:hypothetical protein